MRITFLAHFPGRGGSNTLLLQLQSFFRDLGHDTSVVVGDDSSEPVLEDYRVVKKRAARLLFTGHAIEAQLGQLEATMLELKFNGRSLSAASAPRFRAVRPIVAIRRRSRRFFQRNGVR